MKLRTLTLLAMLPLFSISQHAIIHIPSDYLKLKNIKSITSIAIDSAEGTKKIEEYYEDGRIQQETSFQSKKMWQRDIDSSYKGKEFQFIRRYYYDDVENSILYAETNVGMNYHDIFLLKQTRPEGADSVFWTTFGSKTRISKGEYRPQIIDTIQVHINKFALLSRKDDTLQYKFIYHLIGKDSIVYIDQIDKYIKYEVYNESKMISCGGLLTEDELNNSTSFISYSRVLFNKKGYPNKAIYFHKYSKKKFIHYHLTYTLFDD